MALNLDDRLHALLLLAVGDAYDYRIGDASGLDDEDLEPIDGYFMRLYTELEEAAKDARVEAIAHDLAVAGHDVYKDDDEGNDESEEG